MGADSGTSRMYGGVSGGGRGEAYNGGKVQSKGEPGL